MTFGEGGSTGWLIAIASIAIVGAGVTGLTFGRATNGAQPRVAPAGSLHQGLLAATKTPEAVPGDALRAAAILGNVWSDDAETTDMPIGALRDRDERVSAIRRTPLGRGGFELAIRRVEEEWSEALRLLDPTAKLDWECHRAGCFSHLRLRDSDVMDRLTDELTRLPSFHHWPGPKTRSGAIEQPDGSIELTWILYADDDSQALREGNER